VQGTSVRTGCLVGICAAACLRRKIFGRASPARRVSLALATLVLALHCFARVTPAQPDVLATWRNVNGDWSNPSNWVMNDPAAVGQFANN
jgi:hypothetical protein